jgi:TolA-binding protein
MKSTIAILAQRPGGKAVAVMVVLAEVAVFLGGGCAYYNMLYNAKAKFKEAEKITPPPDGSISRQQIDAYDIVIKKAQAMIEKYPDSRHVDDGYLLIARSQFGQREYEAAIATVDTLEAKLPESELMEHAVFLKGNALAQWEKYDEALLVLDAFMERYSGSDHTAQALYLASKSALMSGDETKAMDYVDRLWKSHRGSEFRLEADMEIAEIFLEKDEYEKCLQIYERLTQNRLEKKDRYRVWSSMARAYIKTGDYDDALTALKSVDKLIVTDVEQAEATLMKGRAYEGLNSTSEAIETYEEVASRYPKSMYSAEAHFHLGGLYQALDSLEVAKTNYDAVTQNYPRSEFADQSIKNSSNISQLIRLRSSNGEESPDARALRLFSLAEVQLFQFNKPDVALESYRQLLSEFPQSEYAPKAAYAIGYVYGVVLEDSTKAHGAQMYLIETYPDSQQAASAREQLGLPPLEREGALPVPEGPMPEEAGETAASEGAQSP